MQKMLKNPFTDRDYAAEQFLSEGVREIYNYVDQNLVDRQDERNVLRASAAPICVRRRWLQAKGFKGHRMAPRSIVNFMLGDLFEYAMKFLVIKANVGPGRLYKEVKFGDKLGSFVLQGREFEIHKQRDLSFRVGPLTITGHYDGLGKRNIDDKWELIEFKSASNFSFEKFRKEGPTDYIPQATALMLSDELVSLGVTECRYFYGRKSSGHLIDRVIKFDSAVASKVKEDYLVTMWPVAPEPPHSLLYERHHGTLTGRKVAKVFPCGVCPYINTKHCHDGLTKKVYKDSYGHLKTTYVLEKRSQNVSV
jgi:hypothetical protein